MTSNTTYHGATAARVEELTQALNGANSTIQSLQQERAEKAEAWQSERMRMSYAIHNGKYKVNRLEGLIDLRENGFKEELQENIQKVSKLETEITDLKNSLKFKEEQIEAAQRLNKEQVEMISAQLEAEKRKVSELRDQMFKASLESQRTASLFRQGELMMESVKQQLKQRDSLIQDLRKEKQELSERLIKTTAQLRSKDSLVLPKQDPWEQKFKALQEQFSKEKEEREKEFLSQINKIEEQKRELEEKNQILTTRLSEMEKETWSTKTTILELETENSRLSEQERTLTTKAQEAEVEKEEMEKKEKTLRERIQELEEENAELKLVITKKKRGLLVKVFKRETEEERALRSKLKAKKKELKELKKQEEKELKNKKKEKSRDEKEEEEASCCSTDVEHQ